MSDGPRPGDPIGRDRDYVAVGHMTRCPKYPPSNALAEIESPRRQPAARSKLIMTRTDPARYAREISDLYDWFLVRLDALPPLDLTRAAYRRGHEALAGPHAELVGAAVAEWAGGRGYGLSARQLDVAFFAAASVAGKLVVGGEDVTPRAARKAVAG